MKTIYVIICISLINTLTFSQTKAIIKNLDEANYYKKQSNESAEDANKDIKECNYITSGRDIRFYTNKAKTEIDNARDYANKAADDIDDAEKKADKLICTNASVNMSDAKLDFINSRIEFNDAYDKLDYILTNKDFNNLKFNLKEALEHIEAGLDYLKKGNVEIDDALKNIHDCK